MVEVRGCFAPDEHGDWRLVVDEDVVMQNGDTITVTWSSNGLLHDPSWIEADITATHTREQVVPREPTALELAAAQLAETVQDYLDCIESGCVTLNPKSGHFDSLSEALGVYFKAGGNATVGGDWEP